MRGALALRPFSDALLSMNMDMMTFAKSEKIVHVISPAVLNRQDMMDLLNYVIAERTSPVLLADHRGAGDPPDTMIALVPFLVRCRHVFFFVRALVRVRLRREASSLFKSSTRCWPPPFKSSISVSKNASSSLRW